jgi:hypothetical protein
MNEAEDQLLKQQAAVANEARCASGMAGMAFGHQPADPGLRERIAAQRFHAERESVKANRLAELEYLLDKNPEVARILDLMEQVRR